MSVDLPDGWRWRAGRAGPDYWQAERLADSAITACAYAPTYPAEEARMLDVAAPVRPRSHMPLMPAEGWPQDILDAGFVSHPERADWLTLPTAHPGLTIAGTDRADTMVKARLYLRAVAAAARERAARPEPKPKPKRARKAPDAPKPARRATTAPPVPVAPQAPAQLEMGL